MDIKKLIQRFWLTLTMFLVSIPVVVAENQSDFQYNSVFKGFNGILNSIATFIGNANTIKFATAQGFAPWHVVGLTFILVTGIIFAALDLVKIFENKSSPKVMIAVVMGIAASAAPGIPEMVFSIFEIVLPIVIIAVLFMIFRIVWHSGSAAARDQAALNTTAKAAQNTAQKSEYETQREKKNALADLKLEKDLIRGERSKLQEMDTLISEISGTNLPANLDKIAQLIAKLQTTRNTETATGIVGNIQQAIAAVSSTLVVKGQSLTKIQEKINQLNKLFDAELKGAKDLTAKEKILQDRYLRAKGKAASKDVKANLTALAQRFEALIVEQQKLLNLLIKDIGIIKQKDKDITTHLQDVISAVYNKQYPQALNHIQTTKSSVTNRETASSMLKAHETKIKSIRDQITTFDADMQRIMR